MSVYVRESFFVLFEQIETKRNWGHRSSVDRLTQSLVLI